MERIVVQRLFGAGVLMLCLAGCGGGGGAGTTAAPAPPTETLFARRFIEPGKPVASVARIDAQVLWHLRAIDGQAVLSRSDDNGATWQRAGPADLAGYGRVLSDSAGRIYLLPASGQGTGLRSQDRGATWQTIVMPPGPVTTGTVELLLTFTPAAGAVVIRRADGFSRIDGWVSRDAGATWAKSPSFGALTPTALWRCNESDRVLMRHDDWGEQGRSAGVDAACDWVSGHVTADGAVSLLMVDRNNRWYRSNDDGKSWQALPVPTSQRGPTSVYRTSYFGDAFGWAMGYVSEVVSAVMLRTTNGGTSWERVLPEGSCHTYSVGYGAGLDAQSVWHSNGGVGACVSVDGGATFRRSEFPSEGRPPRGMIRAAGGELIAAFGEDAAWPESLWRSLDNGLNWKPLGPN